MLTDPYLMLQLHAAKVNALHVEAAHKRLVRSLRHGLATAEFGSVELGAPVRRQRRRAAA